MAKKYLALCTVLCGWYSMHHPWIVQGDRIFSTILRKRAEFLPGKIFPKTILSGQKFPHGNLGPKDMALSPSIAVDTINAEQVCFPHTVASKHI